MFLSKLKKYQSQIETEDLKPIHKFILAPKGFKQMIGDIEDVNSMDIFNDRIDLLKGIIYDEDNCEIIACHKTEDGKIIFYDKIDSPYYHTTIDFITNSELDTNF